MCVSMPSRMGEMDAWVCIERGLGGMVIIIPVAVEVWMTSWWNDRGHVESGRGSCAPIDYAWSCPFPSVGGGTVVGGSPWLIILPEGYACPSGEAEVNRGGQVL
jgi:hypothetical protein